MDRTLLRPMRYGLGCMMEQPADPGASHRMGQRHSGMWGWAGQSPLPTLRREVSFGFVTTTMGSHVLMDPRVQKLAPLVYAAL